MASQPVRAGWVASTTFSTVTHGALIAIAVSRPITQSRPCARRGPTERIERITYVEPARLAEALREARAAKSVEAAPGEGRGRGDGSEMPRSTTRAVSSIIEIRHSKVETAPDSRRSPTRGSRRRAISPRLRFPSTTCSVRKPACAQRRTACMTRDMVERSVQPRRGNPKPRYPGAARRHGHRGRVRRALRRRLDGRRPTRQDRVSEYDAPDCSRAPCARRCSGRTTTPAMIAGHVVAQQVVQEFRFEMGRRR